MSIATTQNVAMRELSKRGAFTASPQDGRVLATYHGRSLALEIKNPGDILTRQQQDDLATAAKAGAICAVIATPFDLSRLLDRIDHRHNPDPTPTRRAG